jgi:hypothetical protein
MELARDDGADAGAGVAPLSAMATFGVAETSAAGLEVAGGTAEGKAEAPPLAPPPQAEALAAPANDPALIASW